MTVITLSGRIRQAEKPLGVALALVGGMAIAAQARINGQLAIDLEDALLAAAISFVGGLAVLLLLFPLLPGMRTGVTRLGGALRAGALRPWHLLGGFAGALMIASQAITVGVLGVAMLTVGVVAGQAVSSVVVDKIGLGPAGPQPLSPGRVLGAALMLVAVVITMWGGAAVSGVRAWLLVIPLAGGIAVAVQQAVNGLVGVASRNAMTATLVNFVGGASVLGLAWLVSLFVRDAPDAFPANPVLYAGGLVGISFIALAAFVVRWIGVLMLGLASIAGQLVGSLLLDLFLPAHGQGLAVTTVGGIGVALVALCVAGVPIRRRR